MNRESTQREEKRLKLAEKFMDQPIADKGFIFLLYTAYMEGKTSVQQEENKTA